MSKGTGLDKLSALVQGSNTPDEDKMAAEDDKLALDTQKVLDFASKLVGKDGSIFDMQTLIESCAEELRMQIRDDAEGEGDGD